MNNRQRVKAIMNYENYDRIPVVHFGFWPETLEKWCHEGHLKPEEIINVGDGNENENLISKKLGFDFNWYNCFHPKTGLLPAFERQVINEFPDGAIHVMNEDGVIVAEKGVISIPTEIDHTLKDRKSWEELYLPRLVFSEQRVDMNSLEQHKNNSQREEPLGLHCGSLFGQIRNWMGIEGISYLYADDEDLYDEIINTVAELCFNCVEKALESGVQFDFAHFWEDICFKNGPLVNPSVFEEKVGPHYKRITELVNSYGIDIVSLDCDGFIDALIPSWINNGVNTMFPIEVGTWGGNIRPWREKYGKRIRGVGGMDKRVFACDYAAVDQEIERLKPLVELGGYIPCPDHRIPPDAKWENVQYYCERMKKEFSVR